MNTYLWHKLREFARDIRNEYEKSEIENINAEEILERLRTLKKNQMNV